MFHLIDSITTTCLKFAEDYLLWGVAIIVAFIIGGAVLRVLKR
jgi:hypothetical protein